MRLLLDTHLLLWATSVSSRLRATARQLIEDPDNELLFSSASIWEMALKSGRKRDDFDIDIRLLRRTLLNSGYIELPVTSEHAKAVGDLPPFHKDPFDRLLIAQAMVEGITLLTSDAAMARYPGPIQRV
jgi:PIN domain nuclease of toxin-antitoxin system